MLAEPLGAIEVVRLQQLTAGASRETWAFEAIAEGVVQPMIVQMDRPNDLRDADARTREGGVLRAVGAVGAPVPELVAADDLPNVLGRSYLITRQLEGETIPRRVLRDDRWTAARRRFVGDCAAALARIHQVPTDSNGLERLPRVIDPLDELGERYVSLDDPHPAFDLAFRWLDLHRPEPRQPSLVHGDFRLGNLLMQEDGLAAILDWELAAIGDPNLDLGWLCVRAWRFGGSGRAAGIGTDDEWLRAYNAAAGTAVDRAALRWWELFGTLRWGVMCLGIGGGFRLGRTDSIESAMVGRRVVENEADIVDLLGELEDEA